MNSENYDKLLKSIEKDYDALMKMAKDRKKIVADAGLLKAGKSSLFNALAGKSVFKIDVVRATIKNQEEELEDYILLDTPGLDARDGDTDVAMKGYEVADVILFVHNLQEGEFTQTEIDSIKQISDIFGDKEMFFKNVILVLTHKDQVEEYYEAICKQIDDQCQKEFNNYFTQVFCVDSVGYMKGLQEGKKLLMQDSGIVELHQAVKTCVNDKYDLQQSLLEKKKKICVDKIEKLIADIRSGIPEKGDNNRISKLKQTKIEIQKIAVEIVADVSDMSISLGEWRSSEYKYLGRPETWEEYSSQSDARSAGIKAIEKMISKAQVEVKGEALCVVEKAEGYISVTGKPLEIKNHLADAYEKIRSLAKKQGIFLKTNFDIQIKDFSTKNSNKNLLTARSAAKGNPFRSAESYANAYSSNLYIDYDYQSKWVDGPFGIGGKMKEVKVYKYDADGAMEDVSSDMVNHLREICSEAKKAVHPVFEEVKTDLCAQFDSLVVNIIKEMDEAILLVEIQQKAADNAMKRARELLEKLEGYKKEVEAL